MELIKMKRIDEHAAPSGMKMNKSWEWNEKDLWIGMTKPPGALSWMSWLLLSSGAVVGYGRLAANGSAPKSERRQEEKPINSIQQS